VKSVVVQSMLNVRHDGYADVRKQTLDLSPSVANRPHHRACGQTPPNLQHIIAELRASGCNVPLSRTFISSPMTARKPPKWSRCSINPQLRRLEKICDQGIY